MIYVYTIEGTMNANNSNCRNIKRLFDLWEAGNKTMPADYLVIAAHLKVCKKCSLKYLALSRFYKRDCGILSGERAAADSIDITNKVMDKIGSGNSITKRSPRIKYIWAVAAIICVSSISPILINKLSGGNSPDHVEIRFYLTAPEASSVVLVGDFTNWEKDRIRLSDPDNDGVWETNLKLKKGEIFKYNFIIDGEGWIIDPNSPINIDDGFGGKTSLVQT